MRQLDTGKCPQHMLSLIAADMGSGLGCVARSRFAQFGHETANLCLVLAALRVPLFAQSPGFSFLPVQLLPAGNQAGRLLFQFVLPPTDPALKLGPLFLYPLLLLAKSTQELLVFFLLSRQRVACQLKMVGQTSA